MTSRPRSWSPASATRSTSIDAAKIGADVMTAPPAVIRQLFKHPLTDNGIAGFLKDWEATGQKIG